MKCPKCGQELKPSKKDPDYMLCFDCKKKYKVSQKEEGRPARKTKEVEEEQAFSNIPPKKVREKREKEMRRAYDEMLSTEEQDRPRRKKRSDELDYEEEKVSKAPVIILGIAIVIVAALIVYMLMR